MAYGCEVFYGYEDSISNQTTLSNETVKGICTYRCAGFLNLVAYDSVCLQVNY
jgi:hypothetical protein